MKSLFFGKNPRKECQAMLDYLNKRYPKRY